VKWGASIAIFLDVLKMVSFAQWALTTDVRHIGLKLETAQFGRQVVRPHRVTDVFVIGKMESRKCPERNVKETLFAL
jgi:hypothetical protein